MADLNSAFEKCPSGCKFMTKGSRYVYALPDMVTNYRLNGYSIMEKPAPKPEEVEDVKPRKTRRKKAN